MGLACVPHGRLRRCMVDVCACVHTHAGYIESVKQLRETLMIQEWDMANKHLAKRK